jgi:hypothetical protein
MPNPNPAGSDVAGAPATTAERAWPLAGWARLMVWAVGRAVVVALIGAIGVECVLGAHEATGAVEISVEYAIAVTVLAIAAAAAVSGALRFVRIRRVVREPAVRMTSPPAVMGRRVRVRRGAGVPDLEWNVLINRRPITGPVAIHGSLESGRWLVVESSDHRLAWPAARAQPVIGTGLAPPAAIAELDVTGAQRRLLGAYAQVMGTVDALPFFVRVPLAGWERSWWWIAAPRPVIAGLVAAHIRKRLRALADAHVRAAVLTGVASGDTARRLLLEAGRECRELAGTLHRRTWPALLASVITFSVPVYLAFRPPPQPKHLNLDPIEKGAALVAVLAFIFFASAPLVVLFRSALYQRVLFRPSQHALFNRRTAFDRATAITESRGWDVYRFEREAFLQVGLAEPRQWEEHPLIPWLAVAGYGLGIAIPFFIWTGSLLSVWILVVMFVSFRVFLTVLLYAIRDVTIRLRSEWPE